MPSTPHETSTPGTKASTRQAPSSASAASTASMSWASAACTTAVPTEEPPLRGLTTARSPTAPWMRARIPARPARHSKALKASPGATRSPASAARSRSACLSMHTAEAPTPEPV